MSWRDRDEANSNSSHRPLAFGATLLAVTPSEQRWARRSSQKSCVHIGDPVSAFCVPTRIQKVDHREAASAESEAGRKAGQPGRRAEAASRQCDFSFIPHDSEA